MNAHIDTHTDAPSRKRIAVATSLAVVIAASVLVAAVLPAEYGVDPLGTGRVLGLLNLYEASADATASPPPGNEATPPPRVYHVESTAFTLRPSEAFEYKYRLEQGRGMVYAWRATGTVKYEFHGDPDGPGAAVLSYEKQDNDYAAGTFTAPATGIHGWYWENPGKEDVTITLNSAGFYSSGEELRPKWDPVKHKDRLERVPHDLAPVK